MAYGIGFYGKNNRSVITSQSGANMYYYTKKTSPTRTDTASAASTRSCEWYITVPSGTIPIVFVYCSSTSRYFSVNKMYIRSSTQWYFYTVEKGTGGTNLTLYVFLKRTMANQSGYGIQMYNHAGSLTYTLSENLGKPLQVRAVAEGSISSSCSNRTNVNITATTGNTLAGEGISKPALLLSRLGFYSNGTWVYLPFFRVNSGLSYVSMSWQVATAQNVVGSTYCSPSVSLPIINGAFYD